MASGIPPTSVSTRLRQTPSRRISVKPSRAANGKSASPGHTNRCSASTIGDRPAVTPCRAATKPSAQHTAAPMPQSRPSTAVDLVGDDESAITSWRENGQGAMIVGDGAVGKQRTSEGNIRLIEKLKAAGG